jgi:hypothetical protein
MREAQKVLLSGLEGFLQQANIKSIPSRVLKKQLKR